MRVDLDNSATRFDKFWPPAASHLTPFALDGDGRLQVGSASTTTESSYVSFTSHLRDSSVQWSHTFTRKTEITGNSSLKLFVQAIDYPDADLYVAVQKLGQNVQQVLWYNASQVVEASAMHGWLRVSHREKDEAQSRPGRPVHTHQRRQYLQQSDIAEVDVEIWPGSTIWEAGETLRLVVQGRSFFEDDAPMTSRAPNSHSFGQVRIWFGDKYDSHLLLPIIGDQL